MHVGLVAAADGSADLRTNHNWQRHWFCCYQRGGTYNFDRLFYTSGGLVASLQSEAADLL